MPQKLVVVGQGYVGLPVAVRATEVGYDVIGVDVDQHRVGRLREGTSYVDDVADRRLQAALASGRYLPTADYDDCRDFDIAVITVPTPLRDAAPDLRFIERAGSELGARLRSGATIILESTTYPGTTEELLAPLLEQTSGMITALNRRSLALKDAEILVLGLAYKKNTGDIRAAPSLRILGLLEDHGARISAVDEHVEDYHWPQQAGRVELSEEVVARSDLILVRTEHDGVDYGLLDSALARVFDTRGVIKNAGEVL